MTLKNRIAVVTGASRGIGRAVALGLAKQGAHVVAVARTQGALEELDDAIRSAGGEAATLVPIDLRDSDALDRLGAALYERWGKLDIFIGNGGTLGPITPLGHVTPKEWEQVMAVNVTANWRLIRSLDPLLQKSDAGRVVLLSSGASWKRLAYWGPYSVSKSAVDALGVTYAHETQNTPIKVMLVNPGPIRTDMRAAAMPGEDPMTLETPDDLAPHIVAMASPEWQVSGQIYDHPSKKVLSFQFPA
jgi:NAD(P)-dependent dehydrogenase (short-subunit alcohol dehydrogenase family)